MLTSQEEIEYNYIAPDPDFRKTKRAVCICIAMGLISVLIYAATGDKLSAAIPLAAICAIISIFNTPLLFMFLYFLVPMEIIIRLNENFTFSKVIGVGIVLSYILTRLKEGIKLSGALKGLLVFAIYSLFSVAWALSNFFALVSVLTLILHIGLIVILANTVKSINVFKLMLWALLFGCCLASVLLIFGIAAPSEAWGTERASFEGTNPNILGAIFALGILGGIYLFFNARIIGKSLSLFLILLVGLGVLHTQSRSALGGLFLAIMFGLALSGRGKTRLLYLVLIVFGSVGAYIGYHIILNSDILNPKAKRRLQESRYDLEKSGRLDFWRQGISYIKQRPVQGFGYGNFPVKQGGGVSLGRSAHNAFISITVELGLVGLSTLLFVYFMLLRGSIEIRSPSLKWLCLSFLSFNLVNGLTHTSYIQKDFWFSIGFVVLGSILSKNDISEEIQNCAMDELTESCDIEENNSQSGKEEEH
jgi:O-antigen ligase